ncbi:MAG: TonB-dependent hemoglobin/transferrin/lactoferrin family receptor [Pseudomonadota bacterium]
MRPAFSLATLILAISTGATAQNTPADESASNLELENITVVGTRTERDISDLDATVSVKTAERLERELARSIADMVRFEPGVSVGGTGSRFGLDGFTIRGIGGNRVLTTVDGIRVPDEFTFGPFLSSRRDFVDLDSLARADIVRGPVSSLYGSDALGGIVAFATKDPWTLMRDNNSHAGLKIGYNSADEGTIGSLTLGARSDNIAGMLVYTRREGVETDNQGTAGGEGPARELPDPQDLTNDNVLIKLSYQPADGHTITASGSAYSNETESDILSDASIFSRGTLTVDRSANDERERQQLALRYHYRGNQLIYDNLALVAYLQKSETIQDLTENRLFAGVMPQVRSRRSTYEQDVTGMQISLSKRFDTTSIQHTLSYGGEFYTTESQSRRDGNTVDIATGAEVREFTVFPARDFPTTDVDQFAVYLQDEIVLADGRLRITPGLRFDSFDASAENDELYQAASGGLAPIDYDDSEVTFRLGAVYHFTDSLAAYARYSEGFRAPPYDDVNVGFANPVGGYQTIANPDLKSERVAGYETGIKFESQTVSIEVAAFYNDYEDFIEPRALSPDFLATGGIDPATGLLTFQSVNRSDVVIKGAELKGRWDMGNSEGFATRFALAYADGEDNTIDQPIDSVEPLNAVLALDYRALSDRWGASLAWSLSKGKDLSDIDTSSATPRIETPGYGIVDAMVNVRIAPKITLDAGVYNINDRSYIRWADSAGIGADAPKRFTQPGTNARITLHMEL